MNAKEQFALAVRIIGVLSLLYIVRTFIRSPSPAAVALVERVACAVIAVWFIRGIRPLIEFAYPNSEPPEKAKV